jgi:mRNA-degrading endonuclease toxin of MazEF toxin-antitoxin module
VVIVGHDALTDTRDDVLCLHIRESPGETGSLVSARVENPLAGYARAATVGPLSKNYFVERLGELDPATLEQVDVALRAALDL